MYLFFDTETNGLPKNFKAPPSTEDNWPRIIQLAWVMCDENLNEVDSYCELIVPNGWTIPNEKFWIENGYSTETNIRDGIYMQEALCSLCSAIDKSKVVIAHNMDFDYPVIASEMLRYGIRPSNKPEKICTMKSTTQLCNLKNARGGLKWPKLEELHEQLFGVKFDNAHDALADVRATMRCFTRLRELQLI